MAFEDKYIDVMGISTRYWQEGGNGSVVILVHGIGSFCEDWKMNVEVLSKTHRVFVFDLVGFGKSGKGNELNLNPEKLAQFTFDFLSAVGVDRAHFIGFSMGGRIVLNCAFLYPDRVLSVTAAAPAGVAKETTIKFRLASLKGFGELLTRPSDFSSKLLLKDAFYNNSFVTNEIVKERTTLSKLKGNHSAFLKTLRIMIELSGFKKKYWQQTQTFLEQIKAPTLIIWGKNDIFLPHKHAEIIRSKIPGSKIIYYDECGHLPQIEKSQLFNNDVSNFIDSVEL